MRITVTIDSDVLAVARALAERNGTSLGRALSELARRGFRSIHTALEYGNYTPLGDRFGVPDGSC